MIEFEEEKRGYNKEQVSEYFETLELEYKNLFDEFEMLRSKNRRLEKKLESIEQQERNSKSLLKKYQKEKEELAESGHESEAKTKNLQKQIQSAEKQIQSMREQIQSMEKQIQAAEESGKHTYGNTIASALVSAEVTSKQIVESARRQAEIIQEEAMRDLTDILKVKMEVLEEVRELAKRLTEISEENQDDMEKDVEEKASGGNESDGGTGEK